MAQRGRTDMEGTTKKKRPSNHACSLLCILTLQASSSTAADRDLSKCINGIGNSTTLPIEPLLETGEPH